MPGILPGMPSENQLPVISRQVGQPPRRAVDLIVIHCAASPNGKPLRQGVPGKPGYLNAPQVINAWHAARGFKRDPATCRAFNPTLPSIGYHYVIDLDGQVWSGRGLEEVGAHVTSFNAHSIGICMVGGIEPQARYTPAQWKTLQNTVLLLAHQYRIPLALPLRRVDAAHRLGYRIENGVCGHRDLSIDLSGDSVVGPAEWFKTCPGFNVHTWLARGMTPEAKHIYEEKQA